MTRERITSLAGRGLITACGLIIVWLGVTMMAGTTLIQPSTTEKRLEADEPRIEVGVDRKEHFWLWLSGHAARLASGGLLLGLGGVLMVKPWTQPKAGPTTPDALSEHSHD